MLDKDIITAKQLGVLLLIDILAVLVWAVSMVISTVSSGGIDTPDKAIAYVSNQDLSFFFNYFNAVILTVFGVFLFIGLFMYYLHQKKSFLLLVGLFTIPIYGLMNIFAYGSQITIIPALLPYLEIPEYQSTARFVILSLTQIYEGTIVSIINLSAYGVLAIPTSIVALEFVKEGSILKRIGGYFFLICGVFCFLSIGCLLFMEYSLAGFFSALGGYCTLFGQIPLAYAFLRQES